MSAGLFLSLYSPSLSSVPPSSETFPFRLLALRDPLGATIFMVATGLMIALYTDAAPF